MNNFTIAFKRLLKNKNTVTIVLIVLCLGILYLAYDRRIQKATEPISVPYALVEIEPRTLITEDMIGTIKAPARRLTNNVILNRSQIAGKYVSHNATIPEGSLFYNDVLVDWEDIPSSLWQDIPDGYTVVSLPVNLETTYGNSMFPGNYIDLYYVTTSNEPSTSGKLIFGKFIQSIKVLSVIDSEGNNIFEKSSELNAPTNLVFSVPENLHLLLRKALYLDGNIVPVPRNAEYSTNPSETMVSSAFIQTYILSQTIDVDDKNLDNLIYSSSDNNVNNSVDKNNQQNTPTNNNTPAVENKNSANSSNDTPNANVPNLNGGVE